MNLAKQERVMTLFLRYINKIITLIDKMKKRKVSTTISLPPTNKTLSFQFSFPVFGYDIFHVWDNVKNEDNLAFIAIDEQKSNTFSAIGVTSNYAWLSTLI